MSAYSTLLEKQVAALKAEKAELLAALTGYRSAVAGMNLAMKDGINVHGAISALIGAEDTAGYVISKATGSAP